MEAVQLETALRVLDLVTRLADGSVRADDAPSLAAALSRSTIVGSIIPRREPSARPDEPKPSDDGKDRIDVLHARIEGLGRVARTLSQLDPGAFERPEGKPPGPVDKGDVDARQLVARRLAEAAHGGDLQVFGGGAVAGFTTELDLVTLAGDIAENARAVGPRLVLTRAAVDGLDKPTRDVVAELGLDLTSTRTPTVLDHLDMELTAAHVELASLEPGGSAVQLIGTSVVIKDDVSFKAGLSVSGSYGPTVEFKASADFAMNHAKEEATKTASKYSKEVTDRASSKVTERRRTEQVLRTLEQFEDVTEHGVDNPAGNGHVIGAYQWVDKVYEAQVYNYGKRMMFDLMIPEPGAFWLYASTARPGPGTTSSKPVEFTLTPADITPYNYKAYVHRYQAAGVKPPPAPYLAVAKTFDGSAEEKDGGIVTKIADVPIPDGYQAVMANTTGLATLWHPDWSIDYALGTTSWRQSGGSSWSHAYTLSNEEGVVPLALKTFHVGHFAVAVEISCQATAQALDSWRLETHAAIQQAYLKLLRDYQDELAALQVQAENAVQGRNPLENQQIERAELRKHTIATFTAQQFDLFGAISPSPQGFPELNLGEAEAEGRYIRFFEQAFEWEQMMYLFYPYYWGRKSNWLSRSQLQDVDPQFAEFLRAGAARVVLPVRPGFETAVAHFLDTGEIWDGANPPLLSSPLYVSIIQEIKERDQAPGADVPQGDPWDVRLPTTLVRLRTDGSLPTWQKNAKNEWVPV